MATQAPHKPQFYVDALPPAEAGIAYPLVRAISPDVSLEQWIIYVKRRCRDGGVRALFDARGMLVGLFSYRLGEQLRHGRVLAIDDFVTFELSQAGPGRTVLMAAAEKLARALNCSGLEVRVGSRGIADAGAPKVDSWTSVGLVLDAVIFTKTL